MIINDFQKLLYQCLARQNSENFLKLFGIFNYVNKNANFPYIFININEIQNHSTFTNSIYSFFVVIHIYDKNTSNNFTMEISNEIKEIFLDLSNFQMNNCDIIDIRLKDYKIILESENTIWNSELLYEFILKY